MALLNQMMTGPFRPTMPTKGSTAWQRYAPARFFGSGGKQQYGNSYLGTFLKLAERQIPKTRQELLKRKEGLFDLEVQKARDMKALDEEGGGPSGGTYIAPFSSEYNQAMYGDKDKGGGGGSTFNSGQSMSPLWNETGKDTSGSKPPMTQAGGGGQSKSLMDQIIANSNMSVSPQGYSGPIGQQSTWDVQTVAPSGELTPNDMAFDPLPSQAASFDPVTGEMLKKKDKAAAEESSDGGDGGDGGGGGE